MRLFCLFFSLLATSVFGFYVGNPAGPALMNTGVFSLYNPLIKGTSGYLADYSSNKHYEASQSNAYFDPNDLFRSFGIHSQMATVSVILLHRMEIFGTVGGSKERAKWEPDPSFLSPSTLTLDFESSYHFSWSAGTRIVFLQWGQTYLSGAFTYFAVPTSKHSYFSFFDRLNLPMAEKQEFYLREWQACAALATRLWILTPYIGGYYLNSHLHILGSPQISSITYKNTNCWGWLYGLTLSLTGRAHINFEQRFTAESACGVSATLVF